MKFYPDQTMSLQNLSCTAFDGHRMIATGPLAQVARATKLAIDEGAAGPVWIFDDRTGRQVELDFRGSVDEVLARLSPPATASGAVRGPGRPRLGVTAREVTLLPRHWDWLGQQPGGASAVLRRLVEQALRGNAVGERSRQTVEAANRFMQVAAGDLPGYEEASRALYRGNRSAFDQCICAWPDDVRAHLQRLTAIAWDAQADDEPADTA
jgi:hypothetical protein